MNPTDAERAARPSFWGLYLLTALVAALVLADVFFWFFGWESLRSPWGIRLALIGALRWRCP